MPLQVGHYRNPAQIGPTQGQIDLHCLPHFIPEIDGELDVELPGYFKFTAFSNCHVTSKTP